MIRIEYDPKAKAMYISCKDTKEGQVDHTVEVAEGLLNVDYDKEGNIIGYELLNLE